MWYCSGTVVCVCVCVLCMLEHYKGHPICIAQEFSEVTSSNVWGLKDSNPTKLICCQKMNLGWLDVRQKLSLLQYFSDSYIYIFNSLIVTVYCIIHILYSHFSQKMKYCLNYGLEYLLKLIQVEIRFLYFLKMT